jgi:hypothetical protein
MLQMLEMAERFHERASRALDGSGPLREEVVYRNLSYALESLRGSTKCGATAQEGQTVRMHVILAPSYVSHTLDELVRGGSLALGPACSLLLTGEASGPGSAVR